jgi:hypothetical protein
LLICANEGCDIKFEPKTHNMKYHSNECCRVATNRRIMEKYYGNRDRKQGKIRFCTTCKMTKLSRYNETSVCSSCKEKTETLANRSVLDMLRAVSLAS